MSLTLPALALCFLGPNVAQDPVGPVEANARFETAWVESATPELLNRTLFVLALEYKKDNNHAKEKAVPVQVGFLIEEDLGVTSFSALVKADNIRARFGGGKPVTVRVVGAEPTLDLAVIRFAPEKQKASEVSDESSRFPLSVDSAESPIEEATWTLFVDPANPKDIRSLPLSELQGRIGAEGDSNGDALLAGFRVRRLGGLPIVDDNGRLAGVWRWSPPENSTRQHCSPSTSSSCAAAR